MPRVYTVPAGPPAPSVSLAEESMPLTLDPRAAVLVRPMRPMRFHGPLMPRAPGAPSAPEYPPYHGCTDDSHCGALQTCDETGSCVLSTTGKVAVAAGILALLGGGYWVAKKKHLI